MSKIIFTLLATSLLLLASFHMFQQNTPAAAIEQVKALKEKSRKAPILDYQFNMTINTFEIIEEGHHNETMKVKSAVRANLIPIHKKNENTFNVIVDYNVIDIKSNKQESDFIAQDFQYLPADMDLKEYVFVGVIDEFSGEILELSTPAGNSHNPILNQVTLELLKSAFPDIRDNQQMLRQAEDDEEIIDSNDLGEVVPHYERFEMEDENGQIVEVLEKTYTTEDFLDIIEIGESTPEVNFQRLAFVDPITQITQRNIRHFDFTYQKPHHMFLQASNDGTIRHEDEITEMHVQIDQDLQIKSITEDELYLQKLYQFIENADLEIVDQSAPSGQLEVNDMTGIEPDYSFSDYASDPALHELLTSSAPLYTKDYDIVEKKFLGQTVTFQIQYKNYGADSNIQAHIMLNHRSIFKLTEVTYKHCGGSYEKNIEKSFNLQIFKAEYPVYGIITIPVQADFTILYGINFYAGPMNQAHGCELTFAPYFKPGIYASGGISIQVAKGGIYARGTIANTELKFSTNVQGFPPTLRGEIALNVEIKPFNYDIGAWYQHITCSLKKLFSWPPKFGQVCHMSDRKEISIIKGGIGAISKNFIFSKTWTM